jgi:hypothetical protein
MEMQMGYLVSGPRIWFKVEISGVSQTVGIWFAVREGAKLWGITFG